MKNGGWWKARPEVDAYVKAIDKIPYFWQKEAYVLIGHYLLVLLLHVSENMEISLSSIFLLCIVRSVEMLMYLIGGNPYLARMTCVTIGE